MKLPTIATAAGLALMLASGSALAWDLHDTLAPGPTPQTSNSPPAGQFGSGADLQLPDVDVRIPGLSPSVGAPVSESRCAEAIARHGEHSAEAWTQC